MHIFSVVPSGVARNMAKVLLLGVALLAGSAFAGGLELKTPFGTIDSTNITPDPATGIGKYNFARFDRAMRKGVAADGHDLYPAMPYPSYAKMTKEDMRALFAYLNFGVTPMAQAHRATAMAFPFNQRRGLSLWNRAFLDDKPFQPVMSIIRCDGPWQRV